MKKITCSLLFTTLALADKSCRFAPTFDTSNIATNQTARQLFVQKVLEIEGKFMREIGYDHETGLTQKKIILDSRTGVPKTQAEFGSSVVSEAYQLAIIAKALNGEVDALAIYPEIEALSVLAKKMKTLDSYRLNQLMSESKDEKDSHKFFIALQTVKEVVANKYPQQTDIQRQLQNVIQTLLDPTNQSNTSLNFKPLLGEIVRYYLTEQNLLDITESTLFLPLLDNDSLKQKQIDMLQKQMSTSVQDMSTQRIDLVSLFQIDEKTASAWLHNTLLVPATQTLYGVADLTANDDIPTLSWETKGPMILSILGGLQDIVRQTLKSNNLYDEFLSKLPKLEVQPKQQQAFNIPTKIGFSMKQDFTSCRLMDFPADFAFGTATAAFQVEGASKTDNRGPSIWDDFCAIPGRIANGDTGEVADDFYHKYQQDILMMKNLGVKHFRLSFSWSRILPTGTIDNVNQKGIDFYNNVLDALIAAGIQPWVTLFHWDLPSALQGKGSTDAWLGDKIINQFNDYADLCFNTFGSKVKRWLTFNEPWTFTWLGYGTGGNAPGRCTQGGYRNDCQTVGGGGDSGKEPYIVTHNVILSHATAVKTYRDKYQKDQGGQIGWTLNTDFAEPYDPSNPDDVKAVDTKVAFEFAWYMDPIVFGKYPDVMVAQIDNNRLPTFTADQQKLIMGSYDFIGINHYTSTYAKAVVTIGTDWSSDSNVWSTATGPDGKLIGPQAQSPWLFVYPPGIRKLMKWVDARYSTQQKKQQLIVFENGVSVPGETEMTIAEAVHDDFRVNFYKGYIQNLRDAITLDGVDVVGYFAWSLMDNFEWDDGYNVRFGMVYVDYKNNQARYVKDSILWYSQFMQTQDFNAVYHNPYDDMIKNQTHQPTNNHQKFLEIQ